MVIKNKIFSQIKKEVEPFVPEKLKEGLTNLTGKVSWAKTLTQELSIRTWLIRLTLLGIIIGAVYGYGWWRGRQGIQPVLDWKGKEEWVSLNEHYLHVKKDGTMEVVATDKKTVLKKITIKDLENLKKNLRPYGFELKPIGILGIGIGKREANSEAGIGVSFFKWYLNNLDTFLTNKGIYLGVSYRLEKIGLENTSIGVGAGKGYKEDNRAIFYGRVKF
jgi:hypothetical protein